MGLPRANRLKHRRDFQAVYQHGLRHGGSDRLALRALPSSLSSHVTDNIPTCIGISVSQKVSKKAVVRNRIKRQIKAAFRELMPRISPGWKIVAIVKPKAVECDYSHFLQELEKLLVKTKIINGH